MIIFLISHFNHMLYPSFELSCQDTSDEGSQHMFYIELNIIPNYHEIHVLPLI